MRKRDSFRRFPTRKRSVLLEPVMMAIISLSLVAMLSNGCKCLELREREKIEVLVCCGLW